MKLNIGVIFGGASVEHEISIISANQVLNVLDPDKYNVIPIYISKEKDMYFSNSYLNIDVFKNLNKAKETGTQVILKKIGNSVEMHSFKSKLFSTKMNHIDVFFPVVHGTTVEDGQLQGFLDTLDATYVGPDTKSSVNGQDKVFMKSILITNGINIVDYMWSYDSDYFNDEEAFLDRVEKRLLYPLIVKPANLGSSIGISKADNREKLKEAIEFAFQYDAKVLIERMIDNLCEVNCAVLGDYSEQETSAIEEVYQSEEFLTYADKYQSKGSKGQGMASTKRKIPAPLDKETEEKVRELAIKGFKVLNLAGNTRVDFLIDKNTNDVYLNETNTCPGSLAYYLWEEAGVPFPELCERLIKIAIKRKREEKQHITTFETNVLENFNSNNKDTKNKV